MNQVKKIIFIILITHISSYTIFPHNITAQEQACLDVAQPSEDNCINSIKEEDMYEQEACCFVTYKNKETGEKFQQCGYLENTEFGIKQYKHLFHQYKEVKILCESNYIRISYALFILFFYFY